jgi:Na+-driven multidrug efflux pump
MKTASSISTSSSTNLTKCPAGSIRELWAIAWPMILSSASASACLMVFGDRLVLSFYSQDAFDASVSSMSWYWALRFVF